MVGLAYMQIWFAAAQVFFARGGALALVVEASGEGEEGFLSSLVRGGRCLGRWPRCRVHRPDDG